MFALKCIQYTYMYVYNKYPTESELVLKNIVGIRYTVWFYISGLFNAFKIHTKHRTSSIKASFPASLALPFYKETKKKHIKIKCISSKIQLIISTKIILHQTEKY